MGRENLVRGTALLLIFTILSFVVAYAFRLVLARTLTVVEYGLFYSIYAFVALFLLIKDMGLTTALSKFIAEFSAKKQYQKAYDTIIFISLVQFVAITVVTVVIFFLSDLLATHYFPHPASKYILFLLLGWFVFNSMQDIIFAVFLGMQKIALFSLRTFVSSVGFLLVVLFTFFLGFGVYAPALSYSITALAIFLVFLPFALRSIKFSQYTFKPTKSLFKKIMLYSLPVFFATAGGRILLHMDTILLTYFRTIEEVGIYNIVLPTASLLLAVGSTLSAVILPVSSALWVKNKSTELEKILQTLYKYLFAALVPAFLVLLIYAEFLLKFLFGQEYLAGANSLRILLFGICLFSMGLVNNTVLTGIGKTKNITKIMFVAVVINIVLNILLIPLYGIVGAAFATSISYTLAFIAGVYYLKIENVLAIPWQEWGKTLCLGVIFLASMFFLNKHLTFSPVIQVIMVTGISSAIYAALIFTWKVISVSEIQQILKTLLK